jgi:aryl-alcohol dehydrogenase-like predicted oxidoreductase
VPPSLKPEQVVGRMHSLEPDFLVHQAECSRVNLGVDTIDVLYLHNPETQLGFVTPGELEERLRRAFRCLEEMAEAERVRWYGVATWDGFRIGALSVERLAVLATEECGHGHRFRFLQLPFNLGMVEAFAGGTVSVLETAARLGINVIASATLAQTQALSHIPESVAGALPGLTNAQRAIQFTRSTPGIGAALVGMARREHVIENLGVAAVAPFARDEYLRFYR